jgi:hypothetical protein
MEMEGESNTEGGKVCRLVDKLDWLGNQQSTKWEVVINAERGCRGGGGG